MPSRDKTPSEQHLKTEEQKVGAHVPPPAGVSPPSVLQGPTNAQNATDVTKRKKNPFDVTAWLLWPTVLVGLVLLVLLAVGYVALLRWLSRRRRKHAGLGPVPGRAAGVARPRRRGPLAAGRGAARGHPSRTGARHRRRRRRGLSSVPASPWLGRAAALPDDVVSASSVAAAVDAVVFGPGEGDPAATDALHGHAEAALTTMRTGVGRWTRLRSDADPRPLLVRRERTGASSCVVAPAAAPEPPAPRRQRPIPA